MKRLLFLVSTFTFLVGGVQAQTQQRTSYPWQQLSSPGAQEIKASFQQPPSYTSNSVTWGWDGPMNREAIARDLDSLKALGFGVATIEAGYRMPVEYLSDGWFQLVKTAIEEAKKRNMHLWIIDEGKYPSGFAGGKFSKERPDLRMQGLVIFERINTRTGEQISKKLPAGVVSAVAVNLTDSSSQVIPVNNGDINWTSPQGTWQVLLVQPQFKTAVTRAVNNPTGGKDTTNALCDYLSPVAVRQFIDFTHEQYKKYIGDEFGRTVLGFRGDEPDFAYIPWTPAMLQEFRQRKGYDIQPYLASFFLRYLTKEQQRAKADYWDVWSDLFGKNFFGQQAEWCAQNHLEYMVHLNHDDAMTGLVRSEGDFFKDLHSVQIPGIDVIWHQLWPGIVADFPKYASSVAHQYGRPRALSESFAAMNPAPDVEQARWIVNHQLARGINLFEFMFFSSTSAGRGGARGYMADKRFPGLMAYANRASYLLAQGRPTATIAVYFPTTSLWLGHNASEKSTMEIAQQLLESQHDFDFIDDNTLTTSPLNKGVFTNKSGQAFRTVIIPSVSVLSRAVYNQLQEFAKSGGQVIFTGGVPAMVSDKNYLMAGNKPSIQWAVQKELFPSLPSLPTDLKLDEACPSLKYLHRQWKDADLYFFFNESRESIKRNVTLNGIGRAEEWDANTGVVKKIQAAGKGDLQLPLELKPYETKFIIVNR